MTNEEARKFAFDSYVTAFDVGNDHMIDQYFTADLEFCNHSVAKNYSLPQIKLGVLEFHKKYQELKSEIKEVFVEGDRIAFRVEHQALFLPDDEYVRMAVMNLYKLTDGKVKEWRLWFSQYVDIVNV